MNPNSSNSGEMPGMQLPPPVEQMPAGTPEQPVAGAEKATSPASAAPAVPPPAGLPLPLPPAMPLGQTAVPPVTDTALQIKDDGDLIEKEWVSKAKQIVERTQEDPYKQSEELTVFKADYMKQRYNKAIKLK